MTISAILDQKLQAFPPNIPQNKREFLIGIESYNQLCAELNRKVKTYKGVKVKIA